MTASDSLRGDTGYVAERQGGEREIIRDNECNSKTNKQKKWT
jgi:hypothetical protein